MSNETLRQIWKVAISFLNGESPFLKENVELMKFQSWIMYIWVDFIISDLFAY